jgi:hypothetical protein
MKAFNALLQGSSFFKRIRMVFNRSPCFFSACFFRKASNDNGAQRTAVCFYLRDRVLLLLLGIRCKGQAEK